MADLVTGLGGPDGFGTDYLAPNDDRSTGAIDITAAFPGGFDLFGTVYNSIYINNNGNVTFASPLSTYTPSAIGSGYTSPIIAPFWADVYTIGGSATGTAAVPPTGGNTTGSDLVWYNVDAATHTITITWDDVGYYSSDNKTNAFQLQLIEEPSGFAEIKFIYQTSPGQPAAIAAAAAGWAERRRGPVIPPATARTTTRYRHRPIRRISWRCRRHPAIRARTGSTNSRPVPTESMPSPIRSSLPRP
jgi:hypothetical protein